MPKKFMYQFEWDQNKAIKNLREHGVAFERAATVFLDETAMTVYDEGHSQNEDRWVTLGADSLGAILIVCHTYRAESEHGATIRIISSFKATRNETMQYKRRS